MLKIEFIPEVESKMEEETIEGVEVAFVVTRDKEGYQACFAGAFSPADLHEIPLHVRAAIDSFDEQVIKDAVPKWMAEELLRSVSPDKEANDDQ